MILTKRTALFALAGLVVLGLAPDTVFGQYFGVAPGDDTSYNYGARRGYNAGFQAGAWNSPYGYGGLGPYGSYLGSGGFLSGTADVIGAQGEFLKQEQEAKLKGEQVKQAKVDTRRKSFDET